MKQQRPIDDIGWRVATLFRVVGGAETGTARWQPGASGLVDARVWPKGSPGKPEVIYFDNRRQGLAS